MNGGDRKIFLDTNMLVFANIEEAPLHTFALTALQEHEQAGTEMWISRQVLREYLATLSRPQTFTPPISSEKLALQIRAFIVRFQIADDTASVTERLLDLIRQGPIGGKQIHDANIVATMLTYNIPNLLTSNVEDFKRFSHLITVLPLDASIS